MARPHPIRIFFSVAGYLLLGWFVGAVFSEHVSLTISNSDFDSFWAWGWLVFWPMFLAVKFFILFLIVVVVVSVFVLAWDGGRNKGWWC